MLISEILKNPVAALLHMERYVNKGSPSGFTRLYTTSPQFSPFGDTRSFEVPLFQFSRESVLIFGDSSVDAAAPLMDGDNSVFLPIHPEMQDKLFGELDIGEFDPRLVSKSYTVIPTASGRTVYCDSQPPFYLKLHYDGILGRVDRKLTAIKSIAGVEISEELVLRCRDKFLSANVAFLPEVLALVRLCNSNRGVEEVGCVLRKTTPFPTLRGSYLVPCFSLSSKDVLNPDHPPLLIQILGNYDRPWEQLRDKIIAPLLYAYCVLVFELGLIPELNAQNVLVALDGQCRIAGVVLRDLQGFEKDLSIRKSLNLPCAFHSAPYKCLDRDVDERQYFIRHSFSFDFKLGEYVLDELVRALGENLSIGVPLVDMREEIKHLFRESADGRDVDHFHPKDSWFAHNKILLTNERPYIELKDPKFRFN
jgi:hypothetical protein